MINPNDLGKNILVDNCQKITIDHIVRQVNTQVKEHLLLSQFEAMGFKLGLLTSNTRFQGKRYWFACPICNNRVGTIFKHPITSAVGCRKCLGIHYRKQRYKGMIEGSKI